MIDRRPYWFPLQLMRSATLQYHTHHRHPEGTPQVAHEVSRYLPLFKQTGIVVQHSHPETPAGQELDRKKRPCKRAKRSTASHLGPTNEKTRRLRTQTKRELGSKREDETAEQEPDCAIVCWFLSQLGMGAGGGSSRLGRAVHRVYLTLARWLHESNPE